MKKESGITLISLIIYVILMTFVVAGVTSITASFRTNVGEVDKDAKSAVAYAKFNMYFLNDIKSKNVHIVSSSRDRIELSLTNKNGETENVKYSVQNNALYRNKVKICDNVKSVTILTSKASGMEHETVSVRLKINNYDKTTKYTLEPA